MVWQKRPSAEHSIPAQVEQMTKWVNLSRELDKCLATYSGGMKLQLLLASVLLGDPKLLILDELIAGLHPKKQVQLRELLAEMAKDQIILVATHVMSDMETVATEILLLKTVNW